MISMRYAWNFSHGQGLVWNPGERIEGFTNLLWTLVMSIFTGLLDKVGAVLAVQITGNRDRAGMRPAGVEAGTSAWRADMPERRQPGHRARGGGA